MIDYETGRKMIGQCEICGRYLYGANAKYECDIIYDFNGEYVCEDCLLDYAADHRIPWDTEEII